jgi:hypothetical protein
MERETGMIFLHSGFRTASTWVWSRFRANTGTLSYYEVFNERLEDLTLQTALALNGQIWHSKHPPVKNYFEEFIPLIQNGRGIFLYQKSMSSDWFIPQGGMGGTLRQEEFLYCQLLVKYAEQTGKVPVLSATRSLGRVPALSRAIAGTHVLIYRNLFKQWCSFTEQGEIGNPYFLKTISLQLQAESAPPEFAAILAEFPPASASARDENLFVCFVLLHLYLYSRARPACDLVMDIAAMATDPACTSALEQQVLARHGLSVDLSGATDGMMFCQIDPAAHDRLHRLIDERGRALLNSAETAQGRDFGLEVLEAFLTSYAAYTREALTTA